MSASAVERLTYPISPEYVKGWNSERAIAELVSNAVDEDDHFSFTWSDGVLVIEDQGEGIPEHGMILGISHKGSSDIGQFGEGKKIAALVLARDPKIGRVRFETVGYAFEPTITRASFIPESMRRNDALAPEVLAYDIESCDRQRGTRVSIECTQQLAQKVSRRFRYFQPGYTPPTSPGELITTESGRIYIGGVFVSHNPRLTFSYDFALEDGKALQNRDRTVLDGWHSKRLIQRVLRATTDPVALRLWLEAAFDGKLDDMEQSFASPTAQQRQLLVKIGKQLIKERYGNKTPCYVQGHDQLSQEQLIDLTDRGYVAVESGLSKNDHQALMDMLGVKSVKAQVAKLESRERTVETEWVPRSKLSAAERKVLDEAVKIVKRVWGDHALDKVRVYTTTRYKNADTYLRWGGFYQPASGLIALQRDNLRDLDATLDVLVHEAAHRLRHRFAEASAQHESGRKDYRSRSRGFEHQLGRMAARSGKLAAQSQVAIDPRQALPDDPTSASGYEDRTHGFSCQLTTMAATAARSLFDAGALPCDAVLPPDTTPNVRLGDEIARRYRQAGHSSVASYARSVGVPAGSANQLLNMRVGKSTINAERMQALAEGVGMRWQVVALMLSCMGLPTCTRRKCGLPYGRHGRFALDMLDEVRTFGDIDPDALDQIEQHIRDKASICLADGSWLAPYDKLVDAELARDY